MIKRKPIPLNTTQECNNNNLHEYSEYILRDGKIVIDNKWFSSLTPYIQKLISTRLKNDFTLEDLVIPHEYQLTNKLLTTVYQSYLDGFDYHIWINESMMKNVKMIHIPDVTKKMLMDKNIDFSSPNIMKLEKKINKYIHNNPKTEYFIRLSCTSGKNEKEVRPFTNSKDIIKHLTSVRLFSEREYERDKDTYLIMMPFIDTEKLYEFRIFVYEGQLTACSPQKYWELRQFSEEELEAIEYALLNISFIKNCMYKSFVADIFINIEEKKAHLIEFNVFGPASGAGSSLFNWIDDYDQLHNNQNVIELRYLSLIAF